MALPPLTPEQRAAALAKAATARQARAELLAGLKTGTHTLAALLARADDDEIVKKTKVASLLKALPGVGQKKATMLMEQVGISETRRAGGLGERQRRSLLDAVSG
jgi:hypothetical protein